MNICIVVGLVVGDGIDYLLWFLCGCGIVKIYQGFAVYFLVEYRELRAYVVQVKHRFYSNYTNYTDLTFH